MVATCLLTNVLCVLAAWSVWLAAVQTVSLAIASEGVVDDNDILVDNGGGLRVETKEGGVDRLETVDDEKERQLETEKSDQDDKEVAESSTSPLETSVDASSSEADSASDNVDVTDSLIENRSGSVSEKGNLSQNETSPEVSPEEGGRNQEEGEISSLEEFKRKKMQEEQQNKRTLDSAHLKSVNGNCKKTKKKSNNYASVDCGAEVIEANAEAVRWGAILQENRDDYMLNPCSAHIWFVVKLCDIILVDTIEMANFELFSSTPKSFRIYVSDRNPTSEWNLLGIIEARADRVVQSFPFDERVYARFIKVEVVSHFGHEHYCPISLFRVLGSTMVEEYQDHEEENAAEQDAEEKNMPIIERKEERCSPDEGFLTLFTNAMTRFLYAFLPLGTANRQENKSEHVEHEERVAINRSTNETTAQVNETSKTEETPDSTLKPEPFQNSENDNTTRDIQDTKTNDGESAEMNTTDNVPNGSKDYGVDELAEKQENNVSDSQVETNVLDESNSEDKHVEHSQVETQHSTATVLDVGAVTSETTNEQDVSNEKHDNVGTNDVHVKYGEATFKEDLPHNDSPPPVPIGSRENEEVNVTVTGTGNDSHVALSGDRNSPQSLDLKSNQTSFETALVAASNNTATNQSTSSPPQNDVNTVEQPVGSSKNVSTLDVPSAVNGSGVLPSLNQQAQKESVFIRLGNKIKNLETNLTLISHYLEELGLNLKKFKKNSTDMQKAFEKRLSQLNDSVMQQQKVLVMQTQHLEGLHYHVSVLTDLVKDLGAELRDFRPQMYLTHGVLIIFELMLAVVFVITLLWFTHREIQISFRYLQKTVLSQSVPLSNGSVRSFTHLYPQNSQSQLGHPIEPKDSGFVELSASQGPSCNTKAQRVMSIPNVGDVDCSARLRVHSNRPILTDLLQSRRNFEQLMPPSTQRLLHCLTDKRDKTTSGKGNRSCGVTESDSFVATQTRNPTSKEESSS